MIVEEDVVNIEVFPIKFFLENKVPQKKKLHMIALQMCRSRVCLGVSSRGALG